MIDLADIFSIDVKSRRGSVRQYRVTFPCGSTWEFDKFDLDIPQYVNGEQTGLTHCYDKLSDALAYIPADTGGKVERIK